MRFATLCRIYVIRESHDKSELIIMPKGLNVVTRTHERSPIPVLTKPDVQKNDVDRDRRATTTAPSHRSVSLVFSERELTLHVVARPSIVCLSFSRL